MALESVVFYVSVDNIFRCVYCLSRNGLIDKALAVDNNIKLLDYTNDGNRVYWKKLNKTPQEIAVHSSIIIQNNEVEELVCKRASELSEISPTITIFTVHQPVTMLLVKYFLNLLQDCSGYRNCVHKNLVKQLKQYSKSIKQPFSDVRLVLNLSTEDICKIDYAWGERLVRQIRISIERECAAAWLSTLGGAFSALGEQSDRFASMALKTSLQQIKLAAESEDTDSIARGWLFLALALSQLGYSNAAFHLLGMACGTQSYDDRHKAMCQGVEVKLKYDRKVRRQRKAKGILETPESLETILKSMVV